MGQGLVLPLHAWLAAVPGERKVPTVTDVEPVVCPNACAMAVADPRLQIYGPGWVLDSSD
jgi:hypothetical protein